ncbi:MAG: S46 family peptidase [Tidjanibacter sp.]|nr:S46 family peptidase [Tidjanibacter sp.]
MKFRNIILSLALAATTTVAVADEGMWLIHNQLPSIWKQMKSEGLKLRPEQIYNESAPALADAVVAINYGMGTGSVISSDGLVITNHHVAYDDIHALSTMEHNYLEDGFAAHNSSEELPTGSTVTFLRKVVDVTDRALALKAEWESEGKWNSMSLRRLVAQLEKEFAQQGYEVSVSSFWRNLKFYAYYMVTYNDVRLVAAPSVHLGAFGGDTDNWGWPQHKCDFAIYRVYTAPDGSPKAYSPENVPLSPNKVLQLSTEGVVDGDFTMVIGFPGRTNRYLSSYAVTEKEQVRNPIVYSARSARLAVMKRHMEADPKVRLKYSDKYFGISNYTDYARWENICLRRFGVAKELAVEEAAFQSWAAENGYGELLPSLAKGYAARANAVRNRCYYQELWFGVSEAAVAAGRAVAMRSRIEREKITVIEPTSPILNGILGSLDRFEQTDRATERELFAEMFERFAWSVDADFLNDFVKSGIERCGGAREFALWSFDNSVFGSAEGIAQFFAVDRTYDEILADPMVALAAAVQYKPFADAIDQAEKGVGVMVDAVEAEYQRALYHYRLSKGEVQYPNANSTMRLTFGRVGDIAPADGVHYASHTTTNGYFEKQDPSSYDFSVSPTLCNALQSAGQSRWAKKGVMYVDFISDNDITGGNSGSPVLDARGRLVGLAFDGNRESMAGDIRFNATMSKTVSVDIRFVMWALESVLNAPELVNEILISNK